MQKQKYALDLCETALIDNDSYHLRYRSNNPDFPVLLFLHGGPGSCDRPLVIKYQSRLADSFTIVCWDQRGAGKSYNRKALKGLKMTIETCVQDTVRVVQYLKKRFSQEKIYVVGHSWGSVLGVLLAQRNSEDIAAYIGMGQFVYGQENERLSYEYTLEEAKRRKNRRAVRSLEKIEVPVNGIYASEKSLMIQRGYLQKFGGAMHNEEGPILKFLLKTVLTTSEYTLIDYVRYMRGNNYCRKALYNQLVQINFFESVPHLKVPVYITQGRYDFNTPSKIAKRWFDALEAPQKEFVWLENSAHSPDFEEPEQWAQTIRRLILGYQS